MVLDPDLCTVSDQAPTDFEIRRVFSADLQALLFSRQADRSLRIGSRLPGFALPSADGELVSDPELLSIGPLAITPQSRHLVSVLQCGSACARICGGWHSPEWRHAGRDLLRRRRRTTADRSVRTV